MEQSPRITSIYEKDREQRRTALLRQQARERAANARKNVITAFTLIRMMLQLAVTPEANKRKQIVRQNMLIDRANRATGDRDRITTLGRSAVITA